VSIIFAAIFQVTVSSGAAFAGAGFIATLLGTLYKTKGLTSAVPGNQIVIAFLVLVAVLGFVSGGCLGFGIGPAELCTNLFLLGTAAAILLVASRFLSIVYRGIRQRL
jgi:hypothetical protein